MTKLTSKKLPARNMIVIMDPAAGKDHARLNIPSTSGIKTRVEYFLEKMFIEDPWAV
jgi:hypothetical protein